MHLPRRTLLTLAMASLLGFAGAVSAAPPPVNTSPPTIAGTPRVGSTLSGSPGVWSPSNLSFAYQWRRCDGTGSNCSDISGATASTYLVASADVGYTLRLKVMASAGWKTASAVSDPTAAVTSAIDVTPPSVSFTSPAHNPPGGYTSLSGIVSLAATASDNVGVASVTFMFGSQTIATLTSAPYTVNYDTSKWPSGQTSTLRAIAKDAAGNQGTDQIYVKVVTGSSAPPPPPPPAISPSTLANGTQGVAYSQQLSATGPTPPYTFKLTQGTLPSGLSLSSAGLIAGVPSASGSFGFTVAAVDATGATAASQAYTLPISGSAPPPSSGSGTLMWAPPGYDGAGSPADPANYPGYVVVSAPQSGGILSLDNTKDYFIKLGHPTWSSVSSGRSQLEITGGRNRVIVGGEITVNVTNKTDDALSLLIDGGDPSGITHIEGVLFDSSVNAITLRTPQIVQIENVRVADNHVYQDDGSSGVHPDLIQTWGGANEVRVDHFSGYTDFTGLSVLLSPNPAKVQIYNTDLHALAPQPGSVQASLPLIGGNMAYMGDDKTTTWVGSAYVETGYYSSTGRRKLDDVIGYGQTCPPYELHPGPGLSGSVYTSPIVCTGGSGSSSSPSNLGLRQGDYETFSRVPLLSGMQWIWGTPPGGDFVPAGVAGTSYVSPGYVGTTAALSTRTRLRSS